jgi:multidrug resistance efflux pump
MTPVDGPPTRPSWEEEGLPRVPEVDGRWGVLLDHAVGASLAFSCAVFFVGMLLAWQIEMPETVQARGELEPVQIWPVRASAPGMIVRALVRQGDSVQSGGLLLELDDLAISRELKELQRSSEEARIERARHDSRWPLDIQAAQRRVDVSAAELVRARARLRAAVADQLGESTRPSAVGADSEPVLLALARSEVMAAVARLGADSAALGRVLADSLESRRLTTLSRDVQDAEAYARKRLSRMKVHAPSRGLILTADLDRAVGRMVQPGELLMEIADSSGWQARVSVTEDAVRLIRVGLPATLRLRAARNQDDVEVPGAVSFVSPEPMKSGSSTAPTRVYEVRLRLAEGRPAELSDARRGYEVNARIRIGKRPIARVLLDRLRIAKP